MISNYRPRRDRRRPQPTPQSVRRQSCFFSFGERPAQSEFDLYPTVFKRFAGEPMDDTIQVQLTSGVPQMLDATHWRLMDSMGDYYQADSVEIFADGKVKVSYYAAAAETYLIHYDGQDNNLDIALGMAVNALMMNVTM